MKRLSVFGWKFVWLLLIAGFVSLAATELLDSRPLIVALLIVGTACTATAILGIAQGSNHESPD
jgi:hypothetical protein